MRDWINRCHFGDVRAVLRQMIDAGVKVQTIVTSPPYWGLRSYLPAGHADKAHEIGSEPTLAEFLATMVGVFDLCREVLRDDGTMFVNMGDSYCSTDKWGGGKNGNTGKQTVADDGSVPSQRDRKQAQPGIKPKDLIGQPWRLAFTLQDAGWWLRQDIIWNKPNPMPESIRDRCTKAHEYIFLLSKSERYFWDFEAMQEPVEGTAHARRATIKAPDGWATHAGGHGSFHRDGREKGAYTEVGQRQGPPGNPSPKAALVDTENAGAYADGRSERMGRGAGWRERKLEEAGSGTKNNDSMDEALAEVRSTRNRRSVWTVPSEPYKGAHFATFPRALIEPCILAGAPVGGVVLDPFFGSGTTGQVAQALGRKFIGIEINQEYKALQDERLRQQSMEFAA
jgi:DNA modification methylase